MPGRISTATEGESLAQALRSLALLAGIGAAGGLFTWSLRVDVDVLKAYALTNELGESLRSLLIGSMVSGAMFTILVGVILVYSMGVRGVEITRRLSARMAPLLLVALLPFLLHGDLWPGRELTMLLLLVAFGFGLRALGFLALDTLPVTMPRSMTGLRPRFQRIRSISRELGRCSWLPVTLVLVGAVGYVLYFSYWTVAHHYRLDTSAYDLGIENNLVWNAVHGAALFKTSPLAGPDASHAGLHQTWFSYLIVPIYALAPRPETLLVLQASMLGVAALPLFFLARRRLGDWVACLLAYVYLFYPPLHGANLYDFHYQPLSTVLLFLALLLLETRRDLWAALVIAVACSLREDIPALVAVLGLFLLLTGRRPVAGLLVMVVSGLFFLVLKFAIMPRFLGGQEAYAHQYKNLIPLGERGFAGILKTVVANPFYTAGTLLERGKLVYVLELFAPLVFLPLWRPIGLLLIVPGFFFTLLATEYPPLVQISFQYTAYWTPFLFIGLIETIAWLRAIEVREGSTPARRRAWLLALAGASLLATLQYGAILGAKHVRGGFEPFRFELTSRDHQRHSDAYALIALVPGDAKIAASEGLVPHVSSRPDAYTIRIGLFDAEYLFFELPTWSQELPIILSALREGAFGVVEERGDFVLAKRGYDTARNREVLRRL